jgi:hypothetical protein
MHVVRSGRPVRRSNKWLRAKEGIPLDHASVDVGVQHATVRLGSDLRRLLTNEPVHAVVATVRGNAGDNDDCVGGLLADQTHQATKTAAHVRPIWFTIVGSYVEEHDIRSRPGNPILI